MESAQALRWLPSPGPHHAATGARLRPGFLLPSPARAAPHLRVDCASAPPASDRPAPSARPSAKDAPQARPKPGSSRGEGLAARPRRGSRTGPAAGVPPPQQRSTGAGYDEAEAAELRREQGWNALLHAQGDPARKDDASLAAQGGLDRAPGQPGLSGPPDLKRLSNSEWEEWALQVIRQKKKKQQQAEQHQRQDEHAAAARLSATAPSGLAPLTSVRQGMSLGRSAAGRTGPARPPKAKVKAKGEGPQGGAVIAQRSIVPMEKAGLIAAGPRSLGQSLKGPLPRAESLARPPSATRKGPMQAAAEDAAGYKFGRHEDASLSRQDSASSSAAECSTVDLARPMLPAGALDRLLSDPRLAPKDLEASLPPERTPSLDVRGADTQTTCASVEQGDAQDACAPDAEEVRPSPCGVTLGGASAVGAKSRDGLTVEEWGQLQGVSGTGNVSVHSAAGLHEEKPRDRKCSGPEAEANVGWTPCPSCTTGEEDSAGTHRGGQVDEVELGQESLEDECATGPGATAGFSAVLEKAIGGRCQAALARPPPLGFGIPLMQRRSASPGARARWEQAVDMRERPSIGAPGGRGRGEVLLKDKALVVASKEEPVLKLLKEHGMTDADLSRFMERRRAPVTTRVELLRERLAFLRTDLGLNAMQLSRLIALHPRVLSHPVHSCLRPHLEFLLSLGLLPAQLPRILRLAPKIFDLSIERSLQPRVAFLRDAVGVAPEQVASVICRSPQVLTQSLKGGHLPRLQYFCHDLSIPRTQFARMVTRHPQLLHYSLSQGVKPRVGLMRSWGLSTQDVALVMQRCPQVLSLSIENALVPKFEYLVRHLGGSAASIVSFPAFFSLSLDGRIKPRYLYYLFTRQNQAESPPGAGALLQGPGKHARLEAGEGAQEGADGSTKFPLCWMALKDEDFCARLGQGGTGEYRAFLADLETNAH